MSNKSPKIQSFETRQAFYLFADIRGFTNWAGKYQLEVRDLISYIYELAYTIFGSPKQEVLLNRVVKFLGDGFFAVKEYTPKTFGTALEDLMEKCILFNKTFNEYIESSQFHEPKKIKFSYGISFGKTERFNIKGMSFDYIGDRINFTARLCSYGNNEQIIIDHDLIDNIESFIKKSNLKNKLHFDQIELKGFSDNKDIIIFELGNAK
ncbi:hypothetical protein K7I13_07030 [Brucepastera parasyntrophica]|uniref:adenylate/guanylate cyclase domain-containing protein n=1 Tax=Brucepastera parasyntrophica TaxID=2880008 RepID=UPI00210E1A22|nr:adenylate/guanylate cyclase domain-containing protein [Brucepastera parasyntrophica]ULQ60999.1 hypothetical protein K7I13_07030 [Brucepastera parasyntrophica]